MYWCLSQCPVCRFTPDREGFPFCSPCLEGLRAAPDPCLQCGQLACSADFCLGRSGPIESFRARYLAIGAGHQVLLRWKSLQSPLTDRRVLQADEAFWEPLQRLRPELIVPIPQQLSRSMKLGNSPALRVAHWCSSRLGIPVIHALAQPSATRKLKRQAEQGLTERLLSSTRFEILPDGAARIRNRRILLVDDLLTTGQTLQKAAEALQASDAGAVLSFCLGFRPRRTESS